MSSGTTFSSNRTSYLPASIDWSTWGQLFLDVDQWRPVVERICRMTGLATASTVAAGFPGTCAVFVVDERIVVKLYPPMLPNDFSKEREVYRLLTGRLPEMPRLLADGVYRDQIDWPFLITAYCAGEAIRDCSDQLTAIERTRIGTTLGRMVRTVHSTPLARAAAFDTRMATWREFLLHRQRECRAALPQETRLAPTLLREINMFLDVHVPALVAEDTQLHLLHADLTEDHLLLVQEQGTWRVSALLDWADTEVGTAEYEWVALWFGLCQRDSNLFRATLKVYDPGLSINDDFRTRMMAFTLLHRFGPGIIDHVWRQDGEPHIATFDRLMDWLWPHSS